MAENVLLKFLELWQFVFKAFTSFFFEKNFLLSKTLFYVHTAAYKVS